MRIYCKVCDKAAEFVDTGEYAENWHPKQKIYKCSECGTEVIIGYQIRQYLTKERISIPQPSPKCKSINVKFHYTEPDFGDAWKCKDCGNIFPGWGKKIPNHLENISVFSGDINPGKIKFVPSDNPLIYSCYTCKNYERRTE